MNYLYWTAVFLSIFSFGVMSRHKRTYMKYDRMWVPLYIFAFISAIYLSGGIEAGIISAVVLFFGNGLLWGMIWKTKTKKTEI